MVDNILNFYRSRISRRGATQYERALKNKTRDFNHYFKNALNLETCFIDGVEAKAVFQDHSQSNNKDLSDDKYLIVENETSVDVGSYVIWRDSPWLVFTEEFKTIPTHQQLKIKTVNENIKWIKNEKICNNGEGWGAHVQNQTLYTLGVAKSGHFLDVVNAKMMMYMKYNQDTSQLKIGDRIFIGHGVYKIMFSDIVSRKGLINFLLEQDTIGENDNVELGIADYWESGKLPSEDKEPTETPVINGSSQGRISRTYKYTIQEGFEVDEWIVDTAGVQSIEILERTNTLITLRVIDDNRNVGSQAVLYAKVGDALTNIVIRISSKF